MRCSTYKSCSAFLHEGGPNRRSVDRFQEVRRASVRQREFKQFRAKNFFTIRKRPCRILALYAVDNTCFCSPAHVGFCSLGLFWRRPAVRIQQPAHVRGAVIAPFMSGFFLRMSAFKINTPNMHYKGIKMKWSPLNFTAVCLN